jgi:adenine deaminase
MASHHPALWHGLTDLGAIAPGYQADLLLLPDLERFVPEIVLKRGRPADEIPRTPVPEWVRHSVRLEAVGAEAFRIPWAGGAARVIGLVPGQIVTDSLVEEPRVVEGAAVADPERDLAKIAVIERHLGTGRIGLGFVRGFGLQRGALASTFAHDAHNLVVVGADDAEMARAVERVAELGGGLVVVDRGAVVAELPLPIAGLMSDLPLAEVIAASRTTVAAVHALGSAVESPFQSLAFLALSVIPSLKLTDHGLVDVDRFELVPLRADALVAG